MSKSVIVLIFAGRSLHTLMSKRHFATMDNQNNVQNLAQLPEVVSVLQKMAPLSLAESWDNVGLLLEPNCRRPIGQIFLTNDLTEDVLEEAESVSTDLIVSYHPPVFAPFKRITSDAWKSRIVSRCLSQGIAIYSPHTSWDTVENGLTDWLISCFEGTVTPIVPLEVKPEFSHVATLTYMENVTNTKLRDGKQIKEYFNSLFDFETNNDLRVLNYNGAQLQLLCNMDVLSSLNNAAKSCGLYFHVNKNESLPSSATTAGAGRLCRFEKESNMRIVIQQIKNHLSVDNLMVALARGSTMESFVNTVAAVAGSGASVLRGVKADVYLTGEMSHHEVLDAVHNNVTVVLANHSNTERNYLKVFASKLSKEMPQLSIYVSSVDKDPLIFV